jgi:hypothetical protein
VDNFVDDSLAKRLSLASKRIFLTLPKNEAPINNLKNHTIKINTLLPQGFHSSAIQKNRQGVHDLTRM